MPSLFLQLLSNYRHQLLSNYRRQYVKVFTRDENSTRITTSSSDTGSSGGDDDGGDASRPVQTRGRRAGVVVDWLAKGTPPSPAPASYTSAVAAPPVQPTAQQRSGGGGQGLGLVQRHASGKSQRQMQDEYEASQRAQVGRRFD
jgi:hypothetical protein